MKFYPNRILQNHRGQDLLDGKMEAASVPLTLGNLAVEALLRELPQDHNAPGNTKIARWKLAKEINKHVIELKYGDPQLAEAVSKARNSAVRPIQLKSEEINLIKSRIQQGFPAMIVGPAEEAIEAGDESLDKLADLHHIPGN